MTGRIYDTVDAPEQWPAVLAETAAALDAKSGLIRTLELRAERAVLSSHYHNLDDRLQAEYRNVLVRDDPYLDALKKRPAGRMVTNEQLVDLERFCKTEYYRHYLEPLDNHFIVGGFVEHDTDGRQILFGLQRHRNSVQFNDEELAFVQQLTPHMRRATHLRRMLWHDRWRAESAETALDALCLAAFLLDEQGHVVHVNDQGERLLRCHHGLSLRDSQLIAANAEQATAFAELLEHGRRAAQGRGPRSAASLLLRRNEGSTPDLLAIVAPICPDASMLTDDLPAARIAIYVGDLDDTGLLRPEILCALYNLTQAESRLAVAIGRGRDLSELGSSWEVSTETLRTQLKAIFAKTGTSRQADLVRLLAGTPWKLACSTDPAKLSP